VPTWARCSTSRREPCTCRRLRRRKCTDYIVFGSTAETGNRLFAPLSHSSVLEMVQTTGIEIDFMCRRAFPCILLIERNLRESIHAIPIGIFSSAGNARDVGRQERKRDRKRIYIYIYISMSITLTIFTIEARRLFGASYRACPQILWISFLLRDSRRFAPNGFSRFSLAAAVPSGRSRSVRLTPHKFKAFEPRDSHLLGLFRVIKANSADGDAGDRSRPRLASPRGNSHG
jgi:hypothetical protein